MKLRSYLFVIVAIGVLAAPVALAQRGPVQGGDPFSGGITAYDPHVGIGNTIVSRVFTNALLTAPDGTPIGKAKTATVQTTTEIRQGLRIQVLNLTPNVEYALVIDSTLVGTATANSTGILKMAFVSPTRGRAAALPEAIKPIAAARSVSIYEASSQRLVASGQFTGNTPK